MGVNALNGLLSFLQISDEEMMKRYKLRCQRPKRAFIISTVPAENPHKHWLCGLIFAGICLNILILKLFQPFFGMFTICSYFPMHLAPCLT